MKRIALVLLLVVVLGVAGCVPSNHEPINQGENSEQTLPKQDISAEEMKIVHLYTTAMKAAFQEENGGDLFIAVELDSLEGLSDKGKQRVLDELQELSSSVYSFEDIKDDHTKFQLDENGRLVRSIDGTLLSVQIERINGNVAIIEATSWFGNLGAVFPKYKASYKNGSWELKLLSIAIS